MWMSRLLLSGVLLCAWSSSVMARRRYRPLTAEEVYAEVARTAEVRSDGTVEFHPPAWLHARGNGVFAFGYDRDFSQEKALFLESTFESRAALGVRFRERMARAAVGELPWRARAILCDPERSIEERRRLIYQLWEDAAEPEDAELGVHGAAARAVIERFVAMNLPAGSPVAYTIEELAAINQGRGRMPAFDPYAPGAGQMPVMVPLPEHVDELDPEPQPAQPSDAIVADVRRALEATAVQRHALLFVAWDDSQSAAPVDRAYVERFVRAAGYDARELARYDALRGDDAFSRASH
jgi:hypothetical protein